MAHLESVKSISSAKSVLDNKSLNILLLGESRVGKTALIKMYFWGCLMQIQVQWRKIPNILLYHAWHRVYY